MFTVTQIEAKAINQIKGQKICQKCGKEITGKEIAKCYWGPEGMICRYCAGIVNRGTHVRIKKGEVYNRYEGKTGIINYQFDDTIKIELDDPDDYEYLLLGFDDIEIIETKPFPAKAGLT